MANDGRMTNPRELKARADFQDFWGAEEPPPRQEEGVLRETLEQKAPLSFDLEERTARFGEAIVSFAKRIPQGPVNNRLIDQLVGAGRGIGANYCEADDAVSKKEFLVKINTCRKEARETKFFLRMVAVSEEALKPQARALRQEAKELHLIFCAILRNAR